MQGFSSKGVYTDKLSLDEWFESNDGSSNVPNKLLAFEEVFFKAFYSDEEKESLKSIKEKNKTRALCLKNSIDCFLYLCSNELSLIAENIKDERLKTEDMLFINALKTLVFDTKENVLLYTAGLLLSALFKFFPKEKIKLCRFDFALTELLCSFGLPEVNSKSTLFLLNRLFSLPETEKNFFENSGLSKDCVKDFMDFCLHDEVLKNYLGLNEWNGELWFNKESTERLVLKNIIDFLSEKA